jgi:hypothetical protein
MVAGPANLSKLPPFSIAALGGIEETVVKKSSLFIAISLAVVGFAYPISGSALPRGVASPDQDGGRFVISSSGKLRYVYKNANYCAPDLGMAVWGRDQTAGMLLGYRCYNNSNG